MTVGVGGWDTPVALDDGVVGEAPAIKFQHGFDTGSHSGRSALIDTTRNEVVEDGQQLVRKADGDLLGSHRFSIPGWYSSWYAQLRRSASLVWRHTPFVCLRQRFPPALFSLSRTGTMHTYTPLHPADRMPPPIADYRFHDALDVVEYARRDPQLMLRTFPDIWHLDDDGAVRCVSWCSSLDGLRRWAEDPYSLRRSRQEGVATGECPNRWVIVEPRLIYKNQVMHEGDVAAYRAVERELASLGVVLLDAVVLDEHCHWWSLHELTTGTTNWRPSTRQKT